MSKIAVFLVLAEGGLCLIPIPKGPCRRHAERR